MIRTAVAVVAAMVVAVVAASAVIGLTSPDGTRQDDTGPPAARSSPSRTAPTSTGTPTPTATDARAPADVAGTWPGRPDRVEVDGSRVDWCPAVEVDATADARRTFGDESVEAAACAAVSFVMDERYSRLSLPRDSYRTKDFDGVAARLSDATARAYYRPRVAAFVADPDDARAAEGLGVVLLRSAGPDHDFYGPDGSTRGYRDRAVWINPSWTTVAVDVDRAKASPRLVARFTARAAVPVFNTEQRRDDMLEVPTTAEMVLRRQGGGWVVGGWDLRSGTPRAERLSVD